MSRKEEYQWYKSIGICPVCHKTAIQKGYQTCLECRLKMRVDEVLHAAHCAPAMYERTPEDIRCKICGRRLKTYYAEERLYAVKCSCCDYVGLVKAKSPSEAAKVFGTKDGGDTE